MPYRVRIVPRYTAPASLTVELAPVKPVADAWQWLQF